MGVRNGSSRRIRVGDADSSCGVSICLEAQFSSVSPLSATRTPINYAEARRLMHAVLVVVLPLFMRRKLSVLNEKRVLEDKLKRFKYGGLYEGMRLPPMLQVRLQLRRGLLGEMPRW